MLDGAPAEPRRLEWIGSSKKDLKALPDEVVDVFGYALYLAQVGQKHEQAKPLRGFGSAGVLEVVHVFQKKSKSGIATPKADLDLIRNRLKVADQRAKELENAQT